MSSRSCPPNAATRWLSPTRSMLLVTLLLVWSHQTFLNGALNILVEAEAQVYLSLGDKEMREIGALQDEMDALKGRARSGQDTSLEERALVSKMYNQLAVQKVCCTQQSLASSNTRRHGKVQQSLWLLFPARVFIRVYSCREGLVPV